jgi:hypothetical protein
MSQRAVGKAHLVCVDTLLGHRSCPQGVTLPHAYTLFASFEMHGICQVL